MCFDDIPANRQAQARATLACGVGLGLRREERLKNPPKIGCGDANAGVVYTDFGQPAGGIRAETQTNHPPAGHRLASIDKRLISTCWICAGLTRAYGLPVVLVSSRTRWRIMSFLTRTTTSSTRRDRSVGSRWLMLPGRDKPSIPRVIVAARCAASTIWVSASFTIGRVGIAQAQLCVIENRRQCII